MSDIPAIIAAIAGALVPVGGAVAFVWNKIESRFRTIEGLLDECQERERAHQQREHGHQERRGVHLTVIELLWQEVAGHNPQARGLQRAKRLLDDLKTKAKEP